ncbi:predicted protein [Botrytis cinerea T4]|uniref:Uncharacterized protein n=1 Tax=Botryotinia fuckeliana (strain T4) TaxID=999810 RepID=G2XYC1_BOTF4|nr:predicted protein [Botrytis cinerea T4]
MMKDEGKEGGLVGGDSFLEPQTLAWPLAGEAIGLAIFGFNSNDFQSRIYNDPLTARGFGIPNALVRSILTLTSFTIGRRLELHSEGSLVLDIFHCPENTQAHRYGTIILIMAGKNGRGTGTGSKTPDSSTLPSRVAIMFVSRLTVKPELLTASERRCSDGRKNGSQTCWRKAIC